MLKTFLDRGVNIDVESDEKVTPFLFTFTRGDYERAELLLQKGANIDHMDKWGNFALKHAVRRRNLPKVRFLLEHGANPLLKDLH